MAKHCYRQIVWANIEIETPIDRHEKFSPNIQPHISMKNLWKIRYFIINVHQHFANAIQYQIFMGRPAVDAIEIQLAWAVARPCAADVVTIWLKNIERKNAPANFNGAVKSNAKSAIAKNGLARANKIELNLKKKLK